MDGARIKLRTVRSQRECWSDMEDEKKTDPANITLQVPGDLYRWSDSRWTLHLSGQVSISSSQISILSDKSPDYSFPISPDPLCVLRPHSGSDRGWSFTARVGDTEERLALRFSRPDTAKKVKDVINSYKPPPVPTPPAAPLS